MPSCAELRRRDVLEKLRRARLREELIDAVPDVDGLDLIRTLGNDRPRNSCQGNGEDE